MITIFFFYVFSVVMLGSATAVVSSRNPVHSVLWLILAFFNAAALFLIAGAEFLAMILVIVYVGAVAVLFLFVVMMLDVDFAQLRGGFQRYLPVGATVGVILFAELVAIFTGWQFSPGAPALRMSPAPVNMSNTQALGELIYTHYVLLFQISGLILLVAMIGAIVLTLRDRTGSKHQIIRTQVGREVHETLEMVNVSLGAGVRTTGIYRPKVTEEEPEPEPVNGGHHHGH